jgi:hypothetical protein
MNSKTAWSRYIDSTSLGDMNTAIAEKVNVDPATVGRWRAGSVDPRPRQVVVYARAYGQSPISALIGAGYLTPEEAEVEVSISTTTLSDFPTTSLAEELLRRTRIFSNLDIDSKMLPHTGDNGNGSPSIAIIL